MSRIDRPRGIGGDRFAVEPIGAVLRVGQKGPRGNPVERDRFTIAQPHEVDGVRPLHPSFEVFNKSDASKRRYVRANLVHASLRDAFDLQRMAFRLPNHPSPPGRHPGCQGDGSSAVRYVESEEFQTIPCPADLCEFAQAGICKIRLKVLFRPNWNDARWPAPLMAYSSRGEHMLSSIYGLWDHVAGLAASVGLLPEKPAETEGYKALEEYGVPMFGMPFSMSLTEKTQPKRRFPVVVFAPDGDLVNWMLSVKEQRAELSEGRAPLALASGSPESSEPTVPHSVADDDADVIDADVRELEPETREQGDWTEKAQKMAEENYRDQGLFDEGTDG